MRRFLTRKVTLSAEAIIVAAMGVLAGGVIFAVAFANVATHTMGGGKRAGALGDFVLTVSTLPAQFRKFGDEYFHIRPDPFPGEGGFRFETAPDSGPEAGFLLLSRYDGDQQRAAVELWDLDARTMVHRWVPDIHAINKASNLDSNLVVLERDNPPERFIVRHPLATEDGGLVFQGHSPLAKVDACGKPVWINDTDIFHHSLERDLDGNLWTAALLEPVTVKGVREETFHDDAIAKFAPDGTLLESRSVSQMLLDNGLPWFVFGGEKYADDPIHLNDIEPVPSDGPFWKRGDLLLSLRSQSLILLYRPSEDRVVWMKQGPWMRQHDVDVLDDHRISVFSNNSAAYWKSETTFMPSDVMVHDLATGETTSPWRKGLEALDVRSATEGLQSVLPDGRLFVEEQNHGRLVMLDADGRLLWAYVNRAEDGNVYRLGWSRLMTRHEGDALASVVAGVRCDGG